MAGNRHCPIYITLAVQKYFGTIKLIEYSPNEMLLHLYHIGNQTCQVKPDFASDEKVICDTIKNTERLTQRFSLERNE